MDSSVFTTRHYLQALLYFRAGRFGALGAFLNSLDGATGGRPYELGALRSCAEEWLAGAPPEQSTAQAKALRILVAHDLRATIALARDARIRAKVDSEADPTETLSRNLSGGMRILARLGCEVDPPPIRIVDAYPAPYADLTGFALTLDEGDRLHYGVEPGVYFRNDRLRPTYSSFLLMHELAHVVLGTRSPLLLAGTFEEGVAELVGLYLSSRILGVHRARTLFCYNRLNHGYAPIWDRYLDAARRAVLLVWYFGWRGLFALLRGGRESLAAADDAIHAGTYRALALPRSEVSESDRALLEEILLVRNKSSILSPLAVVIADRAQPGDTLAELAQQMSADRAELLPALEELQAHQLLMLRIDKSVVTMTAPRRDASRLRYHFDVTR